MKRKLFFLIDKLQIQRSERIAVSVLMTVFLILSTIWLFTDPASSSKNYSYDELEEVFLERSKAIETEHEAIMARYSPHDTDHSLSADKVNSSSPPDPDSEVLNDSIQETADSIRININTAEADELQKLPGIGPAYSKRIVEWRIENGVFEEVEQLLEIRGIGPARLEKIRPMVILEEK